ncbi:MAG: helix-turn-helix domain-containing protein [Syntrophobacteraceae bacterium]|jgi:hypothetical protein|nr:helix-turn-helix domain-containing protein [Syntrophobacteraceae bacterium]
MHELAEHLRAERQKQGLTVAFISEKTRISGSMIDALEAGDFDRIGIPLIIRGFIRSYCEALGLESAPLIEKYEQHIGSYDRQGKGLRKYGEWCRSIRRKSRSKVLLIVLLALLAMGTLIGGAWFSVWLKHQQSSEKTSGVVPSQELPSDLIRQQGGAHASVEGLGGTEGPSSHRPGIPVDGRGAASTGEPAGLGGAGQTGPGHRVSSQPPSPSEVLPADADEAPGPAGRVHVLSLEAIRKASVKVRIDDQQTAAFALKPGDRKDLEVLKVVELELRDAKALRIKWDGKTVEGGGTRLRLPLAAKEEGTRP